MPITSFEICGAWKKDGPVVFISAAIHGDEINGIEVIRRVLHTSYVATESIFSSYSRASSSKLMM